MRARLTPSPTVQEGEDLVSTVTGGSPPVEIVWMVDGEIVAGPDPVPPESHAFDTAGYGGKVVTCVAEDVAGETVERSSTVT